MIRLSLITALSLVTVSAFCQKELPTGQIEVVKDFEVRLIDVSKIRIIPQPIVIDTAARVYEYKLSAVAPSIQYEVPEIKPLSIEPEQKPAYYPLFAKAGYGNPNSLLGQLSYDHNNGGNFNWGLDLRHLSANNKKIELQKFSDTQGRINASHAAGEKLLIDGYFDARFENVFFYGADEIPGNPDALKRSFKRYDLSLELSNDVEEDPAFRYKGLFEYLIDRDDIGAREKTLRLGGEGSTLIGENEYPVGLRLLADLTKFEDVHENALNNILAQPFFKYHSDRLKIHLGATVLLKTEENAILPDIELSYNVLAGLSVYAGWEGEVIKNNFHHLSLINPFLITRLDSISNELNRAVFAGVKGVTGKVSYDASVNYTKFSRSPFFLQDPDSEEQFYPLYDDGSFIGVEASLSFEVLKNVNVKSNFYTRFYSLDHEDKPWHKPTMGLDAYAGYSGGSDVYHVALIFHLENGVPYKTIGGTVSTLDPLIDLNLHGDYFITDHLGAFVQLNNIAGNKRERWAGYPSFGFNAKAGIMFRM
jgi:hypothetical protein